MSSTIGKSYKISVMDEAGQIVASATLLATRSSGGSAHRGVFEEQGEAERRSTTVEDSKTTPQNFWDLLKFLLNVTG